jgi:ubiquinone/menaquinone biosynthesis C-methylase UbiE
MDKIYYNEYYYLERENWWFRVRADIIMEAIRRSIPNEKKLSILNVGAATGHTSKLLEEFGEVVSIEYDTDCFQFTKERLNINIINASATELPFGDNQFDMVCCFDVIEHIEEDGLAVKEMARVCKKDGHVHITVPAFMELWSTHDEVNHHFRRYRIPQLQGLFEQLGGRIDYSTYFSAFLFIPLYVFRNTTRIFKLDWFRKGSGSDFTIISKQGFMDKILYQIFNIERFWLKKFTFPFGSSILFSWKK